MSFRAVYEESMRNPEDFWLGAAEALDWIRAPTAALDRSRAPFYAWFGNSEINGCYNCVDRHVENGHGNRVAIIHDSPVTGSVSKLTFRELQQATARLGGALRARGVGKGDRVVIYMPMIPEALVAMLACARIGAIHSVVFGGFAAEELAARIDDATPKAVIAGSCGIEPSRVVAYKPLLDSALKYSAHRPEFCIIFQRDVLRAELVSDRDVDWNECQAGIEPADCVAVRGSDPAYILYTSGTTGKPKGVVRPTAGHLVALNWTMKNIYDVDPGDVFWAASDVGWVVGHSYIVYAPLVHGNTTIVFEGKPVGTPDAGTFWRVISEHGVKSLFTAPTAFRAIKRADPDAALIPGFDLSCLEALFLAGERSDPDTVEWARTHLQVPVLDHWWQTETGYTIAGYPWGNEKIPVKLGSAGVPMPGFDVRILDDECDEVPRGELGSIAVRLPLPPGCLPTLWNADERYRDAYLSKFEGYYDTGDAGIQDEDGYCYVMARTDDVINVAGHRLSTGQMEEILSDHPDVAECAVIGVHDQLKGQLPLGFLCLNVGCERPEDEIVGECVAAVRGRIGPVAAFKQAAVVDRLPKTRSGKILRSTMVKIADGQEWKMPATIEEPAVLDEIATALTRLGYPAQ